MTTRSGRHRKNLLRRGRGFLCAVFCTVFCTVLCGVFVLTVSATAQEAMVEHATTQEGAAEWTATPDSTEIQDSPEAVRGSEGMKEVKPTAVVQAQLLGPPGHRHVKAVRPFMPGAGRVSWSRQGDWIAYDQVGGDGLYDIHLKEIGEFGGEKCLTCGGWEFRKVNALDPVWHPSGEYLLFRVQKHARRLKLDPAKLAGPPGGLHSEIWMVDRKGKDFLQLTRATEQGGTVVGQHFSYEGEHLVWTERLVSATGRWGEWGLRVAELKNRRGVVRLGKVRTYRPAVEPGFTLAHGFTPNDRGLLISAMSSPGDGERARDLYRLDLESEALERITSSRDQRDSSVTVAPHNSDLLVWVSSRGSDRRGRSHLPYRGDLWMLDEGDGRQERLTFFNHPASDHALGEALIDDLAWNPQGDRLLVHVVSAGEPPRRRVVVKLGESAPPPAAEEDVLLHEGIYEVEFLPTFLE